MHPTSYSHALRILACQQCGAPLDADVSGGAIACSYCGVMNHFARRDEAGDRAEAERARDAAMSEAERVARLRAQDREPEPLPDSIAALLVDGCLPRDRIADTEAAWRTARTELSRSPTSFPISERFFHLTVLLAPSFDERRQRALLETAVEALPDAGHRHVLRCMLARLAARAGDVHAARDWLSACNPRPLDLSMDTAYRFAVATLGTVERDYARVTEVLGVRPGDAPLADRDELACSVLRVHAVAELGDREAAVQEIIGWIRSLGAPAVRHAIEQHDPLPVAREPMREAERRIEDRARQERRVKAQADLEELRAKLANAERPWFDAALVGKIAMVTALLSFLVGSIWSCIVTGMIEADPLFGEHAALFCPHVCEGCHGPYRHASWTTTTNGSESSSHSVYCRDPEGRIDAMEDGPFWLAAVDEPAWMEPYRVPGDTWLIALTMMLAFTPIGLAIALRMAWGGYRNRVARRRKLRESVADAEAAIERVR